MFFRIPFPLTSFASNAKLLTSLGLRAVTFDPRFEIALHQKFPAGLAPSLSVVPFSDALSPVSPESPSYPTNPSVVMTGPDGGVLNPETGIVIGGVPDDTVTNPSSIVRSRGG